MNANECMEVQTFGNCLKGQLCKFCNKSTNETKTSSPVLVAYKMDSEKTLEIDEIENMDFNPIKLSFVHKDAKYFINISLSNDSKMVRLQVFQELGSTFWEKTFNHTSLLDENKKWCNYENTQDIVNLIAESIHTFEFEFSQKYLTLIHTTKTISGTKEKVTSYQLKCAAKEIDLSTSVDNLGNTIKEIKREFDSIVDKMISEKVIEEKISKEIERIEKLGVKIDDFSKKFSELERLVENKNKQHQDEITKIMEKMKSIEKNLDVMNNNHKKLQDYVDKSLPGKEVAINLSLRDYNSEFFDLSNGNKTFKKKGNDGWNGIYFDEKIVFDNTIKEFNFKIDVVNPNCNMKLGFCVIGLSKEGGLHTKTGSWMIDLNNGQFHNNTDGNSNLTYNLRPFAGDVISICLDTKDQLMYFKLNGYVCTARKRIVLNETQKQNLFLCADLYCANDQITIF